MLLPLMGLLMFSLFFGTLSLSALLLDPTTRLTMTNFLFFFVGASVAGVVFQCGRQAITEQDVTIVFSWTLPLLIVASVIGGRSLVHLWSRLRLARRGVK